MDLFETCSFLFLKRFWHICQQNYRISCKVVFVQFSTILNSIALWPNEVQSTKLEKLKIIFHHEDVFLFAGKGNTVSSCFLMLDSWDLCMLLRQRLILAYMAIYYSQLYSTRSEKYLGLTKIFLRIVEKSLETVLAWKSIFDFRSTNFCCVKLARVKYFYHATLYRTTFQSLNNYRCWDMDSTSLANFIVPCSIHRDNFVCPVGK